jgi:UDP-N-acetylglucosamine 2-epimerase (non-hydrolysing)
MSVNILCVIGTRPEVIKMAPVILGLKNSSWAKVRVLVTAQHREILDQALSFFGIMPDIDLDIMQPNQQLTTLTARLLLDFDRLINSEQPNAILAQGDTTSVMTAALAAFYHHIPFGHIEAGLRTWDLRNPFPEEANRVIAGRFARWHFTPTESSRQNLLKDGVLNSQISITGNTVIDSLLITAKKEPDLGIKLDPKKRLVLVTAHRRENFGKPFENICLALQTLAKNNPGVQFLYPVHPNPNIKKFAFEYLQNLSNFILSEPLEYAPFIAAMKRAHIILTDSGGVQEEAPALGKPVLALRNESERPEAVTEGVVKLVGPNYGAIVMETQRLLDDETAYNQMALRISPYGDGKAADRIVEILRRDLAA